MAADVKYDPEAHAYTVLIAEGEVAETVEVDGVHLVDLAADGRVLAIEVLDPDSAQLGEIAARFALADQLEVIEAAVRGAVPSPSTITKATYVSFTKFSGGDAVVGTGADTRSAGDRPVPA